MCIRDSFDSFRANIENADRWPILVFHSGNQRSPHDAKLQQMLGAAIDAVSYTHLDVYKRQS